MGFYPGFNIKYDVEKMDYIYGNECFGPNVEKRWLKDIRSSLLEPDCDGPEVVYAIAMDVGRKVDQEEIRKRNLLYGTVIYAKGQLGSEPIRSQGHIHAISASCNMSTPEVYEIWEGEAIIYMQEYGTDDPGRCFAVHASPGEVVVVPPGWVHATISAKKDEALVFGAWCVRDYGFEYKEVRSHGGIAFFPYFNDNGEIEWKHNDKYDKKELITKSPREYSDLDINLDKSIYEQFLDDYDKFLYVANPKLKDDVWENFTP